MPRPLPLRRELNLHILHDSKEALLRSFQKLEGIVDFFLTGLGAYRAAFQTQRPHLAGTKYAQIVANR